MIINGVTRKNLVCFFLVWWSRRNENSDKDCDIELNYEDPSLEAKICGKKEKLKKYFHKFEILFLGYCFAKCQQQFGACLLAQMTEMLDRSVDICQEQSHKCEKQCFNDKRTSRIAAANWAKVVEVLKKYNSHSHTNEDKKN